MRIVGRFGDVDVDVVEFGDFLTRLSMGDSFDHEGEETYTRGVFASSCEQVSQPATCGRCMQCAVRVGRSVTQCSCMLLSVASQGSMPCPSNSRPYSRLLGLA